MSDRIKTVTARQLIDCKCRPLVEVDVLTENGHLGRGSAPTGSTVGMYESFVLRDGDPSEYGGKSVHKAVHNVNTILGPAIAGTDIRDQKKIDENRDLVDKGDRKMIIGGSLIGAGALLLCVGFVLNF